MRKDESSEHNVVMCDELAPLVANAREQTETTEEALVQVSTGALRSVFSDSKGSSSGSENFGEFSAIPFDRDLIRGNLCAFISSSAQVIGETDASVRSVLTFMPGMRTAIAVSEKDFHLFDR